MLGVGVVIGLRCTTTVLAVIANGVVAVDLVVVDVDVSFAVVEDVVVGLVIAEVVEVVVGFVIVVDEVDIVTGFVKLVMLVDVVAFNVVVELDETTFKVCASAADTSVLGFAVAVIIVDMVGSAAKAFMVVAAMKFCRPNAESGQRQLQSHAPPGCIVPVPCTIAAKADWVAMVGFVNVETRAAPFAVTIARAGACKI